MTITQYSHLIGDGTHNPVTVTHGLNVADARDVVVQLYEVSSGSQVFADIKPTSVNAVEIAFQTTPTTNSIYCVVIGLTSP